MESLEVTAKTVNDAIAKALARLGLRRDQVDISVLSEGSRGILGIGGEDARILVTPKLPPEPIVEIEPGPEQEAAPGYGPTAEPLKSHEIAETAREVLQSLLDGMGVDATVDIRTVEAGPDGMPPREGFAAVLDISDGDLGMLIGRRGETLGALQFITNLILQRRTRRYARVQVDVEGYRQRREQTLRGLAQRIASRVIETGEPFSLEAMPANERRIIHLALQQHPGVMTGSVGEGEHRRVVISPRR